MNDWLKLDEGDIPMNTEAPKNEPRPSMVAVPIPKPELPKHLRAEPTVTMIFPRRLSLNLDEYKGLVHFDAGLQEVPESLATKYPHTASGMHWHLEQQGVKPYAPKPEPTADELAEQLRAKGYQVAPPAGSDDETEETVTNVTLADMTKAQIVTHAFEAYGLELDGGLKKDELIAAVEAHRATIAG